MYLFFDTETTGLPKDWNAHVREVDNWPRIVQIAWSHYTEGGKKLAEHEYIIKPDGYEIPFEASKIHGITTSRAIHEGVDLNYVLDLFSLTMSNSKYLVAHNIDFDKKVIGAEYIRKDREIAYEAIKKIEKICTMKSSTKFCGIKSGHGYKWPTMMELHTKLFGSTFIGAHGALADMDAMVKCFFELKKKQII